MQQTLHIRTTWGRERALLIQYCWSSWLWNTYDLIFPDLRTVSRCMVGILEPYTYTIKWFLYLKSVVYLTSFKILHMLVARECISRNICLHCIPFPQFSDINSPFFPWCFSIRQYQNPFPLLLLASGRDFLHFSASPTLSLLFLYMVLESLFSA